MLDWEVIGNLEFGNEGQLAPIAVVVIFVVVAVGFWYVGVH